MFLFEKSVKEDRDQERDLDFVPLFCSADLVLKEQNLDVESNPLKEFDPFPLRLSSDFRDKFPQISSNVSNLSMSIGSSNILNHFKVEHWLIKYPHVIET